MIKMFKSRYYQCLYKLAEKGTKRAIGDKLMELKGHEQMPAEEIEKLQLHKMKQILKYAYANIPYYKMVFDECGLIPEQFARLSDLERLPYLTKDIIKENETLFSNKNTSATKILRKTGGSTGNKLLVYYDQTALDKTAAVTARCLAWTGKKPGDKEVHFSSNIHDDIPLRDYLKEKAKCFALNRINITLDTFDSKSFTNILQQIKGIKPVLIQGFPSIAYELACYAEKNEIDMRQSFKIYESTGETLYDFQREKIETVFGCEVYNRYGDAEFGIIAYECHYHTGLHIQSDILHLETPACQELEYKQNEIVVTTLTNYMMPLIRYKTGDLGTIDKSHCKCGLPYPRLVNLQGRIHDFLVLDDGREISTSFILDLVDKHGGINNFQVKKSEAGLAVYLMLDKDSSLDKLKSLQEAIAAKLHLQKEKIMLVIVDKLQLTPAGKFRYVVEKDMELAGKRTLVKNKFGEICDCSTKNYFPEIGHFVCLEGFFDQEPGEKEIFVWTKCHGSFLSRQALEKVEILSPTKEPRILSLYDEKNKFKKEITLQQGWNVYPLELSENELIYFAVNKEIPSEEKNNDTRELGIGFRNMFNNKGE